MQMISLSQQMLEFGVYYIASQHYIFEVDVRGREGKQTRV